MSFHGLIAHIFFPFNSITWIYLVRVNHSWFIHSPIKGHLGCFCFWQLWMKLIETFVCRFLGGHKFSTPLVNTKEDGGWIVSKNIFSFVRNCQTLFQSGYAILHSSPQRMRISVALHPHQELLLSLFWILVILIGL